MDRLAELGIEMVPVVGGVFEMGIVAIKYDNTPLDRYGRRDDSLTPVRDVTIPNIEISKFPITVAQYRASVKAGVCEKPTLNYTEEPGHYDDWPVIGIGIKDAHDFANFVGCQILSETVFEYAICGESQRRFPWGEEYPSLWPLIKRFIRNTDEQEAVNDRLKDVPMMETQWLEEENGPVGRFKEGVTPDGLWDLCGAFAEMVSDSWSCCYNSGYKPQTRGMRMHKRL